MKMKKTKFILINDEIINKYYFSSCLLDLRAQRHVSFSCSSSHLLSFFSSSTTLLAEDKSFSLLLSLMRPIDCSRRRSITCFCCSQYCSSFLISFVQFSCTKFRRDCALDDCVTVPIFWFQFGCDLAVPMKSAIEQLSPWFLAALTLWMRCKVIARLLSSTNSSL